MREILVFGENQSGYGRITPAYAGNTDTDMHIAVIGTGSPPRMREILRLATSFFRSSGITPAYAGNTLKNPNKIAIFPRLNSKNYLLFKINPLLHTILQNYNLMKETLTILSN